MPFIDLPDRIPGLRMQARGDQPWYQFRNVAADEAELFLYDEIGGWGTLAEDFIAELAAVTSPKLRVRVSSPGGSVFEGISLANALRSHPADVTVQVDGIAASIASVIAMAGDRVVIQPQAMIMVHEAAGGCLGNAKDMQDMADLLDKISDNIAGAYVEKAGGDVAEWRQVMVKETWYTAEEAVEAGLADEMLPSRKKQAEPDEPEMRTFDLTAYGYTGPKQAEAPKPAPPPVVAEQEPTLVISIADVLDEETVAKLRAAVRDRSAAAAVEGSVAEIVDTACPVHHTATEDRPWDAGPNEKRLPSPMTVKTAKAMYAWYDEAQVDNGELPKTACKLPHHEVSADGKPGAANLSGVRNALSRLPQSDIPAGQHDAVRRHLQAHLDDAKGADDTAAVEPVAAVEEPPIVPAAEPVDEWAGAFAHLLQPEPDPWAEAFAHLINPEASSSAATAA